MAYNYQKENCCLYGTHYCFALNAKDCLNCGVTAENARSTMEWIDEIDALLPEKGVAPLFTGDECLLCKGEQKNKADCYAMTNIGHSAPGCTTRNASGEVVKTVLGAIMPLQLSCCDRCRKRYTEIGNSNVPTTVVTAAALIALLNITTVVERISAIAMWLPLVLYVVVVGISWFIGGFIRNSRLKRYSRTTYLNLMDIPEVQVIRDNGWVELSPFKDMSRFVFDEKLTQQGLYTAAPKTTTEENI